MEEWPTWASRESFRNFQRLSIWTTCILSSHPARKATPNPAPKPRASPLKRDFLYHFRALTPECPFFFTTSPSFWKPLGAVSWSGTWPPPLGWITNQPNWWRQFLFLITSFLCGKDRFMKQIQILEKQTFSWGKGISWHTTGGNTLGPPLKVPELKFYKNGLSIFLSCSRI